MTGVILDASALLALLKEEPGADRVAEAISNSSMTTVNIAEVTSHFVYLGMPALEVDAMLSPLPMRIVDADLALAQRAGHLRAQTSEAGLSLGDRFCLALAWRQDVPAMTADKRWKDVAARVGAKVVVIR